jgi:hypothetical protein
MYHEITLRIVVGLPFAVHGIASDAIAPPAKSLGRLLPDALLPCWDEMMAGLGAWIA